MLNESVIPAARVVKAVKSLRKSRSWGWSKKLYLAKSRSWYLRTRRKEAPRVAVCGFNMSINAAGRAQALADIYSCSFDTSLIGFLPKNSGGDLWEPLKSSKHKFEGISISKPQDLRQEVLDFVVKHPFDIVHLSKPRFVNIYIGILYKIVWGAQVFVDIDDEDLGVLNERQETLSLTNFLVENPETGMRWKKLIAGDGTRVGVALSDMFDGVTVSNPALQNKYGGLILPHARFASQFEPDSGRKMEVRSEFGIPQEATVFLFFGTARKHKGVLEVARALATAGREDAIYVVAGLIPDPELREKLEAIDGSNLRLLPAQPYDRVPDIVGMADATILLQDESSLLAQYQLPAKLVDAMAMGLQIFVSPTPAVWDIIEAGAARAVRRDTIKNSIAEFLEVPQNHLSQAVAGRQLFLDRFSVESCSPKLKQFVQQRLSKRSFLTRVVPKQINSVFSELGGWADFRK